MKMRLSIFKPLTFSDLGDPAGTEGYLFEFDFKYLLYSYLCEH